MDSNKHRKTNAKVIALIVVLSIVLIGVALIIYMSLKSATSNIPAITGTAINEDKKISIYFVRHGKTDANVNNVFAGSGTDAKLIQEGIDTTKKTGYALRDIQFDNVFTSELNRAKDTAGIILSENNQRTPNIDVEPLLNDIDWGDIEGMTNDEVVKLYPDFVFEKYIGNVNDKSFVSPIKATSENKMANNFYEALRNICKKAKDGGNVLVVGHSSFVWLLDVMFPEQMKTTDGLNNSSITVLEYNKGKWTLKQVNKDADNFSMN